MLKKLVVTEECRLFHGGKSYPPEPMEGSRQISLLNAFERISHACNYPPYSIDAVSATKISISRHIPAGHYWRINFSVEEADGTKKCLQAEKETLTFTGDTDIIAPLLEYLYWFHSANDSNPIPGSLIDTESAGPSWLPSLLLFIEMTLALTATEKKILGRYGIDSVLLSKLDSTRRSRKPVNWLDIVAANELWFEVPQATFADMLKKHCL